MKANEYMLSNHHDDDDNQPPSGSSELSEDKKDEKTNNKGTMIMGLIRTKLEETTLTSIALSVFVTNLFKIQARILFELLLILEIFKFNTAELNPNGA